MELKKRGMIQIAAAGGLFLAGMAAGNLAPQHVSALNKFGQPKTVIHVVAYKFRDTTSQNDQDQAIAGIKDMAAKIPGIKNIWIKSTRVQPRDYNAAFAIEFENKEAAEAYAKHPAHDAWMKIYEPIHKESRSQQITN